MQSEQSLKALIRAELPAAAFQPRPWRRLLIIPIVGLIVSGSSALALLPLPWYVALPGSVLIGSIYGSLMFLGHEIAHAAANRERRGTEFLLYVAFAIFCLPPHLWRVWHNQVHHPNANVEGLDPDNFGTLDEFESDTSWHQYLVKYAPGSGHWLSALFLFSCFTVQIQGVLWMKSKRRPGFDRLRRTRTAIETLLLAGFWVLLGVLLGLKGALLVIVIPMIVGNFVVMSYIATNHMLSPMSQVRDTLGTTMSVTTYKLIDVLHFNFSHHVEHHLFPSMHSSYYPAVRACLQRHAGGRYMAPPHGRALLTLLRTPRVYANLHTLVEPYSGRRVELARVEALLRDTRKSVEALETNL